MENMEAIEYLNDVRNGIHIPAPGIELPLLNDKEKEAVDLAIAALEQQEKDRWIQVTEKLPEDEYVLISKKPTKLSGSKWNVVIAMRTADPRSGKIQWRDSGFGVIQDDKVLAWRPLPEPYQEDKA